MDWYRNRFPVSMTVGERKAKALRAAEKLGRKQDLDPVIIDGPLASTWWGKAWNRNLEGYADYSNRIPRGRSYARHGSVIDLRIAAGSVSALVQGSQARPYEVTITISAMDAEARDLLVAACAGKLESTEALLEGRFPEDMTRLLMAEKTGLFPHPRGIRFSCTCPDSARLCKHVAASLYGVGARLDRDPSLFFHLRKIALEDLISHAVREETQKLLQAKGKGESVLLDEVDGELSALFGIDLGSAGERQSTGMIPVAPGIPGNASKPVAGRKKSSGRKPADRMKVAPARKKSVKSPGREKELGRKNLRAIRDALAALEILSVEVSRLESDLKAFL